jgi:hypothetical protein
MILLWTGYVGLAVSVRVSGFQRESDFHRGEVLASRTGTGDSDCRRRRPAGAPAGPNLSASLRVRVTSRFYSGFRPGAHQDSEMSLHMAGHISSSRRWQPAGGGLARLVLLVLATRRLPRPSRAEVAESACGESESDAVFQASSP